jgi:hypothetical protein
VKQIDYTGRNSLPGDLAMIVGKLLMGSRRRPQVRILPGAPSDQRRYNAAQDLHN